MFNPKYRIRILSESFPQDQCICLGTQLIKIIDSIKSFLPQHIWYGADVEATGKGARKYNLNTFKLSLIGTDLQFIEYCSGIEQFIWGIFLCIGSSFSSQNIQGVELETEDEPFRSIGCGGIILEIRAFDTTFFEIYTDKSELINIISGKYNSRTEKLS